jgi:hypothetical protein
VFLLKIFIEDNNVEVKPHRMNVRTSQEALVNGIQGIYIAAINFSRFLSLKFQM